MEKKLYCVRVVLFVMAENESDARVAATRSQFDIFECTARKAKNIKPEWKDAIPFNANDERTCSEIMNGKQKTNSPAARPAKMPAFLEPGAKSFDIENRSIQPGQQN